MEKIIVKADKRPEIGKGGARSLRREGLLPAVVYSGGDSTPVKINLKEMTKLIYSGAGEHSLITIQLNDEGGKTAEHPVLVKDYQRDPVSEDLLHVDFMQVALDKIITVNVALEVAKKPIGIKMGGIMQRRLREIEVECLPTEIPDKIEIDAESIQIGQSFHVSDLAEIEGVKIVTDPAEVILSVTAPVVEEAPAEEEEAEAAEPELVKGKGKEEEEGKEEKKEEK
jgi:large subunit ribosomal protein L25